jgi:hypothetical protein
MWIIWLLQLEEEEELAMLVAAAQVVCYLEQN